MVYSLVNASAIGFDVVRRPAGARLADVLLTALSAPPVLLWEIAAAHPAAQLPAQEQREWLAASALMRSARAAAPPASKRASADRPPSLKQLGTTVAGFSLGRGHHLDRLIATELLDPGTSIGQHVPTHMHRLAADTFAEEAVTAWAADHDESAAATPTALHQATTARLPAATIDLGPNTDRLMDLLTQVSDIAAAWIAHPPTGPAATDPLVWAQAMHEASWAAELSGRVRPAAAAQLLTSAALARSGAPTIALAGGLWNAVSGQVAATVVADLLPAASAHILTGPSQLTP